MFKGKVSLYKNIDGKEEKIEQEFDDPSEYRAFVRSHPEFSFRDPFPSISFPYFGNVWDTLEDMVDRRMRLWSESEGPSRTPALPEGVQLDRYEEEIRKMDEEKANKEATRKSLEEARDKLKNYIKRFKEAGNDEKTKQAEQDLKKVEEKIKGLAS